MSENGWMWCAASSARYSAVVRACVARGAAAAALGAAGWIQADSLR
ncbi:hypothetical protein BCCR75501_03076 [Burkholderia sola]|nr:hypothetical protein BCCR75389_03079 [Burkholderia cenocepacia]CAG2320785.1 hypothetical protein BCCR75587_03075 [Burkholderia cenocepacia]CAG2320872.1 hypothetical protein BCCR75390_03084 [Burkholderia cenocepacia]CAG2321110.1 hypothetical protein BCCR75588_03082 [Burkholderia cenocepacia]CAG2321402.1 hypothetical protein BCCR75501_03076 [Burkholderia cenocepacia]